MRPDLPAAFDEGHLASGDGHLLWYAQYGKPQGTPLLWLHGGPGSASSLRHIGLIDLARYRLVLADQRGCGRSLPLGALQRNDTGLLVADIDRLRDHLRIDRMVIGGGSWGATLALLYAAQHPASVAALLLRAPFLASKAEIDAFFAPPASGPTDEWTDFAALAPPSARRELLPWLAQQLAVSGQDQCARIALGWSRHERQRESAGGALAPALADDAMIARYRIQAHYLLHGCFIDEDWLPAAARRLHGLPTAILHGDADRVCPPHNARLLQRCLPASRLRMVGGVGHDPFHPGMAAALTEALDCYARNENFDAWGSGHE
ncbi:MAG: Proline iminopeptidase [Burkholderia sp.]|nr:Proline iminopeptidase [Burkholderia sp.]